MWPLHGVIFVPFFLVCLLNDCLRAFERRWRQPIARTPNSKNTMTCVIKSKLQTRLSEKCTIHCKFATVVVLNCQLFLSSSRGAAFLSWNVDRDYEEENLSGVTEYSSEDYRMLPLILHKGHGTIRLIGSSFSVRNQESIRETRRRRIQQHCALSFVVLSSDNIEKRFLLRF